MNVKVEQLSSDIILIGQRSSNDESRTLEFRAQRTSQELTFPWGNAFSSLSLAELSVTGTRSRMVVELL